VVYFFNDITHVAYSCDEVRLCSHAVGLLKICNGEISLVKMLSFPKPRQPFIKWTQSSQDWDLSGRFGSWWTIPGGGDPLQFTHHL
jgi:hypothetical protein